MAASCRRGRVDGEWEEGGGGGGGGQGRGRGKSKK